MAAPREDLPFCKCRWLENAARDPNCPIEFDPKSRTYCLKTSNGGEMLIYHCPFCAGRARRSMRKKHYATITPEETIRLYQLTKELKTEADVISALGEPSRVFEPGSWIEEPEKGDKPNEIRVQHRRLVYDKLSATADVHVKVDRYSKISVYFRGKYLGKPDPGVKRSQAAPVPDRPTSRARGSNP